MKHTGWIILTLLLAAIVVATVVWRSASKDSKDESVRWAQQQVSPGPLSPGHTFLAENCAACHTPVRGVEAASCIACHANNESLLQRQPTSFHADVTSCRECHIEHQKSTSRSIAMDHEALATVGLRQVQQSRREDPATQSLTAWLGSKQPPENPKLRRGEATLNCASCHGNQDAHRGFFGQDCSACHGTSKWTIPEFRHPSATSTSCAQCHQAPPSHYMEHFRMVSATVAGKPHAQVYQCYLCHQTTDWNDIKGVGYYKHH